MKNGKKPKHNRRTETKPKPTGEFSEAGLLIRLDLIVAGILTEAPIVAKKRKAA